MTTVAKVAIYTDGTCREDVGVGGWGVVLKAGQHERTLSGSATGTVLCRMQLIAVIEGLRALSTASEIQIFSDAPYITVGGSKKLAVWPGREWKNEDGSAVKNVDLWSEVATLVKQHTVTWVLVSEKSQQADREMSMRAKTLSSAGLDERLDGLRVVSPAKTSAADPTPAVAVAGQVSGVASSGTMAQSDSVELLARRTEIEELKSLLSECLPLITCGLPISLFNSHAPTALAARVAAAIH